MKLRKELMGVRSGFLGAAVLGLATGLAIVVGACTAGAIASATQDIGTACPAPVVIRSRCLLDMGADDGQVALRPGAWAVCRPER